MSYSYSAGALPGGLSLNATFSVPSSALTASGIFNFTIKATDANGYQGTHGYNVTVNLVINPVTGLQFYPLAGAVAGYARRTGQLRISTPFAAGISLTTLARNTCEGIAIPPIAQAVVGNFTVLNQTAQTGYLTIYPDGQAAPLTANIIYGPGRIFANNFTVGLSANGAFNVFGERTIDVVVDVAGYYSNEANDVNGAGCCSHHWQRMCSCWTRAQARANATTSMRRLRREPT